MDKGFDHTTQLGYSIAAGVGKLIELDSRKIQNAIAISGSTFNPLVVTRAPHTSQWKGMLSSHVAFGSVNCCLMAAEGMTGPLDIFEGKGGYNDDFDIKDPTHWEPLRLDLYKKLVLKKYNAEVHTQSAIEATLILKKEYDIDPGQIVKVRVKIFKVAYDITGGGDYGPRDNINVKEDADHSLPYIIAVALLDGQVMPAQFKKERIVKEDVQNLLKRVEVSMKHHIPGPKKLVEHMDPYTRAYPDKLMCSVEITLDDGKKHEMEVEDVPGFHTRPFGWTELEDKFRFLAHALPEEKKERIIKMIKDLENVRIKDLMTILSGI
jgi:2-methylcitrate dehydratase